MSLTGNSPEADGASTPKDNHLDPNRGSKALDAEGKKCRFDWKHGGYYCYMRGYDFFRAPKDLRELKPEIDLLDSIKTLVDKENITKRPPEDIKLVRDLIKLHRILENTRARRRLERWSLLIISLYLLCVLGIVLVTYFYGSLKIPDSVMIAILTSTSANIIGLGFIILRGHVHLLEDLQGENLDSPKRNTMDKDNRN